MGFPPDGVAARYPRKTAGWTASGIRDWRKSRALQNPGNQEQFTSDEDVTPLLSLRKIVTPVGRRRDKENARFEAGSTACIQQWSGFAESWGGANVEVGKHPAPKLT